jgi:hypothetical protein
MKISEISVKAKARSGNSTLVDQVLTQGPRRELLEPLETPDQGLLQGNRVVCVYYH